MTQVQGMKITCPDGWLLDSDKLVTEVSPAGPYRDGRYSSVPIRKMASTRTILEKTLIGFDDRYSSSGSRGRAVTSRTGSTRRTSNYGAKLFMRRGAIRKIDANQARVKEVAAAEQVLSWLSNVTPPLASLGLRV